MIDNRTSGQAVKGVGTILSELKADGKIEDYDTTENTDITNIKFDVSSITLGAGDNEKLTATFESGSDNGGYYAQIKGKKYPVSKVNDKIEIGKTEITTSGNSKREIASVQTSNSAVATAQIIENEKDKVKITGVSGGAEGIATATITINYTESISTTITVTVKAKYTVNLYASSTATVPTSISVLIGENASDAMGYVIPSPPEGKQFDKWLLKTSVGGNLVGEDATSLMTTVTSNLDVYATFADPPVKYAVQIYGINQDIDENNQTLGLTFGPATGDNYNNKYVTHRYNDNGDETYTLVKQVYTIGTAEPEETQLSITRTSEEIAQYGETIHDKTWTQIAAVTDKTKFTDSMLCGDTKSVSLSLNSNIKTSATYTQNGDGAGQLFKTLSSSARNWNPSSKDNAAAGNGGDNGSNGKYNGAYKTSHIRATLIGKTLSNPITSYSGNQNFDTSDCLYSCIESDLQDVIVAKKINYITGSSNSSYVKKSDISDAIWLFSLMELNRCVTSWGTNIAAYNSEGIGKLNGAEVAYAKFTDPESRAKQRTLWDEAGDRRAIWLRTPNLDKSDGVWELNYDDYSFSSYPKYSIFGITFGFCIK